MPFRFLFRWSPPEVRRVSVSQRRTFTIRPLGETSRRGALLSDNPSLSPFENTVLQLCCTSFACPGIGMRSTCDRLKKKQKNHWLTFRSSPLLIPPPYSTSQRPPCARLMAQKLPALGPSVAEDLPPADPLEPLQEPVPTLPLSLRRLVFGATLAQVGEGGGEGPSERRGGREGWAEGGEGGGTREEEGGG